MSYKMNEDYYNLLYKRYLRRSPKEMLRIADIKPGNSVLDLCCGSNGRASKSALEMGASYVCAVDSNMNAYKLKDFNIDVFCDDIESFFLKIKIQDFYGKENSKSNHPDVLFDIVVCQQGVNYWINKNGIIKDIHSVMNYGGKFVFNTFNKCPSHNVSVKEYIIDGLRYVEVFNSFFGSCGKKIISHLQCCDGYQPHYTEFYWISPEEYIDILSDAFDDIKVFTDKNTDIYLCTK